MSKTYRQWATNLMEWGSFSSSSFAKPESHPLHSAAERHGFKHENTKNMLGASVHTYSHPSGKQLTLHTGSGGDHSFNMTTKRGKTHTGTTAMHLYGATLREGNYALNKNAHWGIVIPTKSGHKVINGNGHKTATTHDHLSHEHFGKKTDDMLKAHPGTLRFLAQ